MSRFYNMFNNAIGKLRKQPPPPAKPTPAPNPHPAPAAVLSAPLLDAPHLAQQHQALRLNPDDPDQSGHMEAHQAARDFVTQLSQKDRAKAFGCLDAMWKENGNRIVPISPDSERHNAGTIRSRRDIEDLPMFVTHKPKVALEYAKHHDSHSIRAATFTIMKPARVIHLADFSQSHNVEYVAPKAATRDTPAVHEQIASPMGELVALCSKDGDTSKQDKRRAHIAKAWAKEKGLDGYYREPVYEESLITAPKDSMRIVHVCRQDEYRERYNIPRIYATEHTPDLHETKSRSGKTKASAQER